ncbi:DUF397 domain-containing protein [Streptomyces sp. NPDC088730]|uniref:DUF397 domain-containing protein n=1 Tax=Streptomyces sp. NPDC088730 TaxID=3365877 RepID=UPI0037F486D8
MDHEGARWFKSSYRGGSGTECVEAAFTAIGASVRDSKQPSGGPFHVSPEAWAEFVG